VDEFRAELHGGGERRLEARPDATADPIPGLQDQYGAAGLAERGRRREPRRPGADHDDVLMAHGMMMRAPRR
jgi:hypothetical protein